MTREGPSDNAGKTIPEELYERYLCALLDGDFPACRDLANQALDGGIDIKVFFQDLIQRSMYEVGRLWETNEISVATEHLASAMTERLLAEAYPRIFRKPHGTRTAIVSCTANEFHQLGGRIVADTLEMNGWHGYFLGADTPVSDLVAMVNERKPDLVALSLSIYFNMPRLIEAIEAIRAAHPGLPILVGGQAFAWGGQDIPKKYPGVRLLRSLDELEALLTDFEEGR